MIRAGRSFAAVAKALLILLLAGQVSQAVEPAPYQTTQKKLETLLETPIDIELQNSSLREVIADLATDHGFAVRFDERELAAHWVSLDEQISVRFTGKTIKSVLEFVLQLQGLEPRIEDGAVVIDIARQPIRLVRRSFTIIGLAHGIQHPVHFTLILEQKDERGFDLADTTIPPEDDEGRRRLIAQRAVYSLLGSFNTRELFAKHMQSRLLRRIDAEHHICGLTDSQRGKLQLAGNGEIEGLVQLIEQMCNQFMECYEPGERNVELPPDFIEKVWRLKQVDQRGVFGADTKYSRMHERLLTSAQKQKLQVVSSLRGSGAIVRIDSSRGVGVFEVLLTSCPVNETVLLNLASFPELETLSLESTRITDDDLQHLKSLPRLISLDLNQTGISDIAMRHIATLAHLDRLGLAGTQVTDAGIEPLLMLKRLKWIDVSETAITDAGMSKLRTSFADITIVR